MKIKKSKSGLKNWIWFVGHIAKHESKRLEVD